MVAFFSPAIPYVVPTTMIDVIKHLGIESGLQLCVDAGDATSYPGTGQSVTDLSGNSTGVQFGSTSGVDTDDPTFVGVAGRQSSGEYFQTVWDGSVSDKLLITPIPSFYHTMHKQNAAFTFVGWLWVDDHDEVGADSLFSTINSASPAAGIEIAFFKSSFGNVLGMDHFGNGKVFSSSLATSLVVAEDQWLFIAVAFDEAAGTYTAQKNATQESGSYSYAVSPTENSARVQLAIAAASGSLGRINSGMLWNRKLSTTELTALYNATKTKFGL